MTFLTSSLMTRDFRSGPATTRSIAASKSSMKICCLFSRAAFRAASFTMFARSAPVKPGVRRGWPACGPRPPDAGRRAPGDTPHEAGRVDEKDAPPRLARHGARQEGLAASRRPQEEHAARDLGAEGLELFRVLEKLDDFLKLGLLLFHA